ncbi:MAG TPA: phosphoenolpyruvate--protein phosphotransferase [Kiloniellales bacterium]|nr:phosphoenolpyruvate--protein phosphotransferase [Kiloniellales bacterium]
MTTLDRTGERGPAAEDGAASGPEGGPSAGLRGLLGRLREVMKCAGSGQERLDRLVDLIAAHMHAEVCSVYVVNRDGVLELVATKGLRADAVHRTRLRPGEGLVGDIAEHARPLALSDAQSHPKFAYRPETGEEIYHSFCGTPLLRGGQVLGTLAVQNVRSRSYSEEEIEALETVAMVLTESLAGGELEAGTDLGRAEGPARLDGRTLNEGLAMGTAVLHGHDIVISKVVAEEPEAEIARLDSAMTAMQRTLDETLARPELTGDGEHRDVLETFRLFAGDRGWARRIRDAIRTGLTAEAAVELVLNDTRAHMQRVADPYLRERLSDFGDLGTRLLRHLLGFEDEPQPRRLPADAILIANHLGPAELLDYDRARLRAVVLAEGTHTSHVAIVARALDLPVIGGCRDATVAIRPGDEVIVDADHAQVLARPAPAVVAAYEQSLAAQARRKRAASESRNLPAVTRDGVAIALLANAGLLVDLPAVRESGAEGIGLYRTEVPFMVRAALPDVAAQTRLYRRVLEQAEERPVVFRTLDIGGDKVPAYWNHGPEENPALGWRGIRIGLDRPKLLLGQLRALVRAAAGRPLAVMFPMVGEVAELDAARRMLGRTLAWAERAGHAPPSEVRVGVMLEVPALLWQIEPVLARVDFLAVGSNDLVQYLFAADRGNPRLARRFDLLSPAALSCLRRLVVAADAAGKPISVCGEAAGQPLEAMALIGCGFRRLSMSPARLGRIKLMLRSLEAGRLAGVLDDLLARETDNLRPALEAWAQDHGVALD